MNEEPCIVLSLSHDSALLCSQRRVWGKLFIHNNRPQTRAPACSSSSHDEHEQDDGLRSSQPGLSSAVRSRATFLTRMGAAAGAGAAAPGSSSAASSTNGTMQRRHRLRFTPPAMLAERLPSLRAAAARGALSAAVLSLRAFVPFLAMAGTDRLQHLVEIL